MVGPTYLTLGRASALPARYVPTPLKVIHLPHAFSDVFVQLCRRWLGFFVPCPRSYL